MTAANAVAAPGTGRRELVSRVAIIVLIAVAIGAGIAINTVGTVILVLAGLAILGLVLAGARVADIFLGCLAGLLIGYAFLGRGFAYIGGGPIYLSELLIPVALFAWVRGRQPGRFGPVSFLLVVFMTWGAIQTIPYLGRYGIDALRDSVTWAYGVYALAVAAVIRSEHIRTATRVYAKLILPFLIWVPIAILILPFVGLPNSPGSDVPIVFVKGGDLGVHLGAVGAFILLGLYARARGGVGAPEPVLWAFWLFASATAGLANRSGLLAVATVGATMFYVRAAKRWLILIFVGLVLLVPVLIVGPTCATGRPGLFGRGHRRERHERRRRLEQRHAGGHSHLPDRLVDEDRLLHGRRSVLLDVARATASISRTTTASSRQPTSHCGHRTTSTSKSWRGRACRDSSCGSRSRWHSGCRCSGRLGVRPSSRTRGGP